MGAAILRHRSSDVNCLRHWRMHVQTSYVCPMVFDVSSTSWFAYVTIIILCEASAKFRLLQQWASDVNDLAYITGSMSKDGRAHESKIACFWYNYSIINCLLTIFVHNYYAHPIYYAYINKYCEFLTDWSIPLTDQPMKSSMRTFRSGHSLVMWYNGGWFQPYADRVILDSSIPLTSTVCGDDQPGLQ